MLRRVLFLVCVVLGLFTQPGDARADSAEQSYQLAFSRYKNGLYEDAAEILRKLLAVKIDPEADQERARVYRNARPTFVACLFGIAAVVDDAQAAKLIAEADDTILAQYRQDPFFKLPGDYSQEVADRWTRVYFEHRDELEALKDKRIADQQEAADLAAKQAKLIADRVTKLELMAAQENFVETRSRVVAAIPFGVGQFQNDDVAWGVFFAVSQTAFIASSVVTWGIAEGIKDTKCPDTGIDEATGELRTVDCAALMTNFEIARGLNYGSLALTGALAITGIIQAQVAFEPERVVTRKREIPPPVKLEPSAMITPEGAYFGLSGQF